MKINNQVLRLKSRKGTVMSKKKDKAIKFIRDPSAISVSEFHTKDS